MKDQPALIPWKVIATTFGGMVIMLLVYIWNDAGDDASAATAVLKATTETHTSELSELREEVAAIKAASQSRYESMTRQLGRIEDRLTEIVQWEMEAHGQRSRVPSRLPGFSRDSQVFAGSRQP